MHNHNQLPSLAHIWFLKICTYFKICVSHMIAIEHKFENLVMRGGIFMHLGHIWWTRLPCSSWTYFIKELIRYFFFGCFSLIYTSLMLMLCLTCFTLAMKALMKYDICLNRSTYSSCLVMWMIGYPKNLTSTLYTLLASNELLKLHR